MERSERLESTPPAAPHWRPGADSAASQGSAERLLEPFTQGERQRLRYLRQLYERGRLTEFPRHPRD